MATEQENEFSGIAVAGIGWEPSVVAKTFWTGKPCNTCAFFEMRMIKNRPTDCFGHVLPYCNHPKLPGDGGQRTQILSSCNEWIAK